MLTTGARDRRAVRSSQGCIPVGPGGNAVVTLLHPQYSVVVPGPGVVKVPLAYPVARHDTDWMAFVNMWIDLKRRDGTIQALSDHWIYGKDAVVPSPRWSVIRNVLHWQK